ncbi:4-hydroxy-tetrahydrodipicolinate synthase [Weeksellaceae bacterium KMM 9724]|uniref:4-hydroxy-tetrahydrodipicolinate synthase n=1 Tax=Profundicola chukchiensis TaxID=2961959 RepID=UPI00243F4FEA|nr:4-hydroxy-tetrahydrodipicolinate synthase [Profundicola chukchiensis]MDG4951313.1 4-hydroxy-tetrahydrodipicolinate synthase [Profundicola chukchiensis]
MNKDLIGTGVALITPFDQHNQVDHSGLANLVNHAIDAGVEFLVLMGTTAESATLSKKEKEAAIQTIKATNKGRLPMVIGIGGNNTARVIEEIQNTDLSDYTAILSASPSYNKPTQEGIYQHFKAIAESTDKDIILYNVPGRTASNVEASTTIRLAKEFKNIVAIKEASPNYMQSSLILNEKLEGFMVLSGDDAFGLPMTLAGGKGVISVIGQAIPQYSEMIRLALDKKVDEAYALYYDILNLTEAIYDEGNPAGIKALMQVQGVCSSETRLPLVKASEALEQKIEKLFNKLK